MRVGVTRNLIFPTIRRSFLFRSLALSSLLSQRAVAMSNTTTNNFSKGALIFLHGLGDTPIGWSSLEDQLSRFCPNLSQIEYVFPASPTIPISINGGMKMPGWFDLYDWPIGVGVQNDTEGLERSVKSIEECVEDLQRKGIDKSKIVIGGFSQGGAVALRVVFSKNSKSDESSYAGCVNLSGWLTFEETNKNVDTPLFWGHGSFDDKVLFEQQRYGVDKLNELGITQITSESYPMGHSSNSNEIQAFAEFLDNILFNDESVSR